MVIPSPFASRSLPSSSVRRQDVVYNFVSDPLSSGLVWVSFIRGAWVMGLTAKGSVCLLTAILLSRASPSSPFLARDYILCIGILSGFARRTCQYYLKHLTEKGFLEKVSLGRYVLTDRAKEVETSILAKAEECIKLRNEVLAKYSK